MRTPASTFGPFQSPLPVWGATISKCIYFTESLEKFQSTLPVWGATSREMTVNGVNAISIHAPRVGSDQTSGGGVPVNSISIHAPRVGSDSNALSKPHLIDISIHAPRVGSDQGRLHLSQKWLYFNPRSPCGERLHKRRTVHTLCNFNPRSPCGERLR